LSFDRAKDQTLYGKECLRASLKTQELLAKKWVLPAVRTQMAFGAIFAGFLAFSNSSLDALAFPPGLRALPKMFLFCLLSFPRYWYSWDVEVSFLNTPKS
jgi:hypothetical protein